MKKYIYKLFKICIQLILVVLIAVFLIKKVNGGGILLKKILPQTQDTEESTTDLRK